MYYLKKWTLNFYVDIQNIYGLSGDEPKRLITVLDQSGNPTIDPADPTRYSLKYIDNQGSGTILPTIGIIVEF
jgi:hypothetical protein